MTTIQALLTHLVASGRWENWHAVHDCLVEQGREEDTAWMQSLEIRCNLATTRWWFKYSDGKDFYGTKDFDTEAAAHTELLNRLVARLGLAKVKCAECDGKGWYHDDSGGNIGVERHCTDCDSRGFHLAELVPCQRCSGSGSIDVSSREPSNFTMDCLDCQGRGTVAKEPA